jgi:hypothetical protein
LFLFLFSYCLLCFHFSVCHLYCCSCSQLSCSRVALFLAVCLATTFLSTLHRSTVLRSFLDLTVFRAQKSVQQYLDHKSPPQKSTTSTPLCLSTCLPSLSLGVSFNSNSNRRDLKTCARGAKGAEGSRAANGATSEARHNTRLQPCSPRCCVPGLCARRQRSRCTPHRTRSRTELPRGISRANFRREPKHAHMHRSHTHLETQVEQAGSRASQRRSSSQENSRAHGAQQVYPTASFSRHHSPTEDTRGEETCSWTPNKRETLQK